MPNTEQPPRDAPSPTSPQGRPSPLSPLSPHEEALLRELGRVMTVLPRVFDADMMREKRMPLSEYMTLMHLSEAPDRRMRMSELAAAANLSLSGMTRIVTRLENQGLTERTRCDEDARGLNAVLTDAGLARLEEAWPAHLASARRHVFDHLEGTDLTQLIHALRRIAT
ncbi:MarR family winged helix-turn-helix transcriptional regulator [Streptomyces sp. NBC_00878]|uniref:MarR family winged helix-turn-helix transcriptional regulator n=1 Tax=Streptomyces sp. NBC_00878 TaxID=2975854 RepID=UPI002250148E|nr:MarR family winged helix-turn-helix transcriptional regulator [Streptomyces sp. NBC_00878]MCX4909104.1 MarR family winged helix-turn-helix transcriptional regulator [Streptomyces sp. NBC_00878]